MSTLNVLLLRMHQIAIVMHQNPFKLSGLKQAHFITSYNSLELSIWIFLHVILFGLTHVAAVIRWLDCDWKPNLHVEQLVLAVILGILVFLHRPSYPATD